MTVKRVRTLGALKSVPGMCVCAAYTIYTTLKLCNVIGELFVNFVCCRWSVAVLGDQVERRRSESH